MRRPLKAAAFDAMKASATKYRGIGGGSYLTQQKRPLCSIGHAAALDGTDPKGTFTSYGPVRMALTLAGIEESENDNAVQEINRRLGRVWETRVTFKRWCEELGVVRG